MCNYQSGIFIFPDLDPDENFILIICHRRLRLASRRLKSSIYLAQQASNPTVNSVLEEKHVLAQLNSSAVRQIPSQLPAPQNQAVTVDSFCGFQAALKSPAASLTLIADVLACVANADGGLALFLHEKNIVTARGER